MTVRDSWREFMNTLSRSLGFSQQSRIPNFFHLYAESYRFLSQ